MGRHRLTSDPVSGGPTNPDLTKLPDDQATRRARLFVALALPDGPRTALSRWVETECADPALRPVAADALHITLCFLGTQPVSEVAAVEGALGRLTGGPIEAHFGERADPLPERRPRLFALAVAAPGARALQEQLSADLTTAGLYKPEERPYWPHVTLARVRRERRRPFAVSHPPGDLPVALRAPFELARCVLYRSDTSPHGSRYTALAEHRV